MQDGQESSHITATEVSSVRTNVPSVNSIPVPSLSLPCTTVRSRSADRGSPWEIRLKDKSQTSAVVDMLTPRRVKRELMIVQPKRCRSASPFDHSQRVKIRRSPSLDDFYKPQRLPVSCGSLHTEAPFLQTPLAKRLDETFNAEVQSDRIEETVSKSGSPEATGNMNTTTTVMFGAVTKSVPAPVRRQQMLDVTCTEPILNAAIGNASKAVTETKTVDDVASVPCTSGGKTVVRSIKFEGIASTWSSPAGPRTFAQVVASPVLQRSNHPLPPPTCALLHRYVCSKKFMCMFYITSRCVEKMTMFLI